MIKLGELVETCCNIAPDDTNARKEIAENYSSVTLDEVQIALRGYVLEHDDAMRCDAMRCDAMRCDAMRCDAMQMLARGNSPNHIARVFSRRPSPGV